MKKFTNISLIICAILAGLGLLFCIVGASFGFGFRQLAAMAKEGVFNLVWTEKGLRWGKDIEVAITEMEETVEEIEDFDFDHIWAEEEVLEEMEDFDVDNTWLEDVEGLDEWMSGGENFEEWISVQEGNWKRVREAWSADEVRNLEVDYDMGAFLIEASDSGQVEVEITYRPTWNGFDRNIILELVGDTLQLKDGFARRQRWMLRPQDHMAYVTIRIPEGTVFEEVSLEMGAAYAGLHTTLACRELELQLGAGRTFSVEGREAALKADEMKLEVGAGQMELANLSSRELEVNCGIGQTKLHQVRADDTFITCGIGQITMSMVGKRTDYNYDVMTDMGSVAIGGKKYNGLGTAQKENNDANNLLKVDCGIGRVDISFEE